MENGIIRVIKDPNNPYALLNKEFINNDKLSWKAKGILVYLLSKPDYWMLMESDLVKISTDGRDAVSSGIRELIEAGYIVRQEQWKGIE